MTTLDTASASPVIKQQAYFGEIYNDLSGPPAVKVASADGPVRDLGEMPPPPKVGDGKPTLPKDPPKQEPPKDDAPFDPFKPRFNNLEKTEKKPDVATTQDLPFKGLARPFNENGQTGNLYVDERSGLVIGMEFTGGTRVGQRFVFERDAAGNLTKMHMKMPGRDTAERFNFEKTAQGWVSKPTAGQTVPNFKYLQIKDGVISGDFKINNKGDITYEQADKQAREVLRVGGNRERFNMRDYSRTTEQMNGQSSVAYWDGYNWRAGQQSQLSEGVTQVVFQPAPAGQRAPVRMVRNANTDGFEADFGNSKVNYKVESWNHGRMTRTTNGASETIYNTGVKNADGRLHWTKGQEKMENGARVVQFSGDQNDARRIQTGELPTHVAINQSTGDVVGSYGNGNRVLSSSRGEPQQIAYKNGQTVDVLREPCGEVVGFRKADGTVLARGLEQSQGKSDTLSAWTIQRPGQQPVQINGRVRFGNGGAFEIVGANNDGYSVDADGSLNARRLNQPADGTTTVQPKPTEPNKEAGAASDKPAGKPLAGADKPTDKPAASADNLPKDEQLKELATKYKINPAILAQARERAKSLKLDRSFTVENLDKLLSVAAKYRLDSGLQTGASLTVGMSPGALVGRMIPELLANPETALPAAQQEMKGSLGKSMRDGGAPPQAVDRAMKSVDNRFNQLKTSLNPFVVELKARLAGS